jgi:hypothetical protein
MNARWPVVIPGRPGKGDSSILPESLRAGTSHKMDLSPFPRVADLDLRENLLVMARRERISPWDE